MDKFKHIKEQFVAEYLYEDYQQDCVKNSLGMTFVTIPEGTFTMGSPESEPGRFSDETQREVHVKSFEMLTTPVTQKMWEELTDNFPSYFTGDRRPVESVSWNDVQEFIRKMNDLNDGYNYRLPTEEEWEYAARAGTSAAYFFGNSAGRLDEYAWYCDNSDSQTHEVGLKKPNPWGLYDVYGNVWEWTDSFYGGGSDRVIRGGSWYNYAQFLRSADRYLDGPEGRYYDLGARLVRILK